VVLVGPHFSGIFQKAIFSMLNKKVVLLSFQKCLCRILENFAYVLSDAFAYQHSGLARLTQFE
jgi:hypothetical protein